MIHESTAQRLTYLASLLEHMRTHNLVDSVSTVKVNYDPTDHYVHLYPFNDTSHLEVFTRWLPTLTDITVKVTVANERHLHLLAQGQMTGGVPTGVVVLLDGSDRELVEVNAVADVGAQIPVGLLLSLVDARAAESRVPVAAGTAVTS